MRLLCVTLAALLAVAAFSLADEAKDKSTKGKIDKAKLVGTWTFVKTDGKEGPPEGATVKVEFTKDGKVNINMSLGDKTLKINGTYTVDGSKLTTVMKGPNDKEKKEVMTIKELTDKKLVMTEKKGDDVETTEFKK